MTIKLSNLLLEMKNDRVALDYVSNLVKNSPFKNRVFLVGGGVRDLELGLPIKDIDLVVTGDGRSGLDFAIWATKEIGNYKLDSNPVIFPKFFTAKFTLKGVVYNGIDLSDVDVETVAPRREKYTPGSRKPEVESGELKDDMFRRDACANSLLMNLTTGEILDLTGNGLSDIRNGILRTPLDPDITFSDDPLRMMRFIRQANKYNWEIADDSMEGIKRNAFKINNISKERIQDELNKILLSDNSDRGIRMLKDVGLLSYVIPELQQAVGMTQNKHHSEDVFDHIMTVLSNTKPNLIARLGALCHDLGKVATRQVIDNETHFYDHENIGAELARNILIALKYPTDIINPVVLSVKNHMRLKGGGKEGEKLTDKTLRKFVVDMGDHLENVLDIIHSDNLAHSPDSAMPNQIPNIIKRIELLKNTIPNKNAKLPVTGDDLLQMGLKPGRLYKELLDLVRDRQLEIPNTTKEEYLMLIKNYLKNKNI